MAELAKKVVDELFSVPESAKMVRVSEKTMWRKVYSREISSVTIGRLRRIPLSAIEQLIARGTVPAVPQ